MKFQDEVYVITGTNSGIGKACATLLLDKEATVKHNTYRADC